MACAAHGDCEALAPEAFHVEDVAVTVGEAPNELMLEAARARPSVAIRLLDSESGAQVYPPTRQRPGAAAGGST